MQVLHLGQQIAHRLGVHTAPTASRRQPYLGPGQRRLVKHIVNCSFPARSQCGHVNRYAGCDETGWEFGWAPCALAQAAITETASESANVDRK